MIRRLKIPAYIYIPSTYLHILPRYLVPRYDVGKQVNTYIHIYVPNGLQGAKEVGS